ncbi:spore coat protein U domain-containing protein [Parasphingorhabdus flavimaris]|uniref:spore coat protein U domain-containing protein n=1 Tax=Parasphingorhabdus flavimaris TaxID=266812 RepID=UPI003001014A
MKKIVMAALATSVAMAATPAMAASSDSKDFIVRANVPTECSLENPGNVNFGNLSIDRAPGPDALTLDSNHNAITRAWTSCNWDASIKLESDNGGLENQDAVNNGPDASDFTDKIFYRVEYRPETVGNFQFATLNTDLGQVSTTTAQTGAYHENARILVKIAPQINPLRPLAGRYTDTVTITLGAI